MSAPARIAGFVTALVAAFAVALAVGHLVGPDGEPAAAGSSPDASAGGHDHGDDHGVEQTDDHDETHDEPADASAGTHDHEAGATEDAGSDLPGGLAVSEAGYTLVLDETVATRGNDRPLSFVIEGPDGPVTEYDVRHDREMHLVAVRRDFSGFQHVHPTLAADGTWTTDLDLTPGAWRVFADFAPTGATPLTLGADLTVPGRVTPGRDAGTRRVATVDGYTVRLDGDLTAGEHATLRLGIERAGRPVTDLEPYLGAYGHLVALRSGDLAYLHVHPVGTTGAGAAGPETAFEAEVPSAGTYHLYLDFQHDGVVRTARFQLDAGRG